MWISSKSSLAASVRQSLVAFAWLLGTELLATVLRYKTEFAANGEYIKYAVGTLALCAAPAVLLAIVVGFVSARGSKGRAVCGMVLGSIFAWSISFGRHFASLPVRSAFVLLIAAACAAALLFANRLPKQSWMPLLAVVALGCVYADMHWLTDLYLGFHVSCALLAAAATMQLHALSKKAPTAHHGSPRWHVFLLLVGALCLLPLGKRQWQRADNVRRIASEHGYYARHMVRAAAAFGVFGDEQDNDSEILAPLTPETLLASGRAPDWSGKDMLLFTIDALRADHLGSYGYPRARTPHFDALAREGKRFEYAYCPTPHTSYSITSLMTGKYMHPLVGLGLGQDSDTIASWLRTYGYRTAAFYPPAVFYIDGPKFSRFEETAMGFEYAKVEFADRELRVKQVRDYVASAPKDKPLFLWVHAFEPHEPYEKHDAFDFGDRPIDRYDSEVAEADALFGEILAVLRQARPGAVAWVTADHGEEFGEHGGAYHGTSLYEEQVRVPLLVAGTGVTPGVVSSPVQTIDIAATLLGTLRAPKPARVRGQDLSPLLGANTQIAPSYAYADTDALSFYADKDERLVCRKREAYCDLYDIRKDPLQTKNLATERPARLREMRAAMRALERSQGAFERGETADLPEVLKRALAGEKDAAAETCGLLDDVSPGLRAKAAEALADIASTEELPALARAKAREKDPNALCWLALAEARAGGDAPDEATMDRALHSDDLAMRDLATLVRAAEGKGGYADLRALWLARARLSMPRRLETLSVMKSKFARESVPDLVEGLEDVLLRAEIVKALDELHDARALAGLIKAYVVEPYVNLRAPELSVIGELGGAKRREVAAATARYLAEPEPDADLVKLATKLGLGKDR